MDSLTPRNMLPWICWRTLSNQCCFEITSQRWPWFQQIKNLREWTYYAGSEDEFMTRLNSALGGMPEFPIEVHIAEDPAWAVYENFTAGVRK